ncbi:MAG: hypothetical protein CMG41_01055 [Candidatus Marinimicrobia bacterium]|nr:hypothetical protein [Candidatus Neomarinimicrobiota bacterium]|tara:strand:+ start:366 stop:776 length:411 start_codon:yes stop_codon:yes gene_type:complete
MINKKIYWTIFKIFIPLSIFTLVIIYKTYNKPHKDFNKSPFEVVIESRDLISLYQNNIDNANTKFLDKILLISGKITNLETDIIILDNAIVCSLEPSQTVIEEIHLNKNISVKGRCIGYDDLLEEIRIDHSFIIKN